MGGGGGALVHWSLITHFYPRTVCWRLCVYTSVTITCPTFKLESPNVDQKCKTPWLRSLHYCLRGWITLTFNVKCNLEVKIDPIFGLSKWQFTTYSSKHLQILIKILALLSSLLIFGLIDLDLQFYYIPRIRRIGGCYGFRSKPPAACNGVNAITQKPRDGLFSNLVYILVVIVSWPD